MESRCLTPANPRHSVTLPRPKIAVVQF